MVKQCRDANYVCIEGPILKGKAENFAKSWGHEQFKASNGWHEHFKKRHDIAFRIVSGESAAVSDDVINECKINLSELLQEGYKPCGIFNADETAMFYKGMDSDNKSLRNHGRTIWKFCWHRGRIIWASTICAHFFF